MSAINLFVCKGYNNVPVDFERAGNELVSYALNRKIGVFLNMQCYAQAILNEMRITGGYFCVGDNFTCISGDKLFELPGNKDFKQVFMNKYQFLNDIIELIFKRTRAVTIEFFISDEECYSLKEYKSVEVDGYELKEALFSEVIGQIEKLFYNKLPAARFIVKKKEVFNRLFYAEDDPYKDIK